MKSIFLVPFAALLLAGCVNKDDNVEPEQEQSPAKPPLQRLVGTLTIVEDYAISDKSKAPFATRKLQLNGKIDQLVRVSEGSEESLNFETDGDVPITISGTITETGKLELDNPDGNSLIKGRGDSAWKGTLKDLDFTIRRSKLGIGDEISFRFQVPMSGKLVANLTTREGGTVDYGSTGADFFITLLETVADEPTQRVFKGNFDLLPALGAVPTDAFAKQFYDGLKPNPSIAHTGLVTAPNRQSWTYAGVKRPVPGNGEVAWTESINLSLKLTAP